MPVNSEGPFGSDLFENSKIISTLSKKYFCNSGELIHFYLHAGLFKDESISLQLSEGDYSLHPLELPDDQLRFLFRG